jgi:hypothetical protein
MKRIPEKARLNRNANFARLSFGFEDRVSKIDQRIDPNRRATKINKPLF